MLKSWFTYWIQQLFKNPICINALTIIQNTAELEMTANLRAQIYVTYIKYNSLVSQWKCFLTKRIQKAKSTQNDEVFIYKCVSII